MTQAELLKKSRDCLLGLHKSLVDLERETYEGIHGRTTSGQFLNLLIEDPDFAWLRVFSTLIVDIDEMFAQRDGFSEDAVAAHLRKVSDIAAIEGETEEFRVKFRTALERDQDAGDKMAELRFLLSDE